MTYPSAPQAGEDFATWIRPHLDELIDEAIEKTREEVAAGKLLSQEDQLHLIDQLIKDRKERALLLQRGEGAVQ